MKYLKTFNEKSLSWISKDVNIRIDIDASRHAMDRFFRHGIGEEKITESEIIEVVERSVEELTIALMQNRLNVNEPFVLKDRDSNLNIVAVLLTGTDEFTMKIITVMKKDNFQTYNNQYFLEI